MADGLVSIQHRKSKVKMSAGQMRRKEKKASFQYALRQHTPNKVTCLFSTEDRVSAVSA